MCCNIMHRQVTGFSSALPASQVSICATAHYLGVFVKVNVDDLKGLPQHRLDLSFREELSGLEAIKPVLGDLTLIWSGSGLKVEGRVKTLLKLECDRCLRPYFQSLSVDIEERFVPSSLAAMNDADQPNKELQRDDWVEPLPDNGILDISDIVYQAVTLATPSFCLCGDQCPGPPGSAHSAGDEASGKMSGAKISHQQGKSDDRPIDPRWKNLKTLFPNEDSKENS